MKSRRTSVHRKLVIYSAYLWLIISVGCVLHYHAFAPGMTHIRRDDMDRDVDIRISVLTFNRAESLNKTLHILDELLLDGGQAVLEIWIDVDQNGSLDAATERVARSFRWRKGPSRVHVQPHSVGIYGQWIDTWKPKPGSREIGLIVEDDVDVSPMAYRWLKAVHRAMANRTDYAGATLTSDVTKVLSPTSKKNLAAPKNEIIFMYKCVGSYGFSPDPEHWRRFQDWFHRHKPAVLPGFRPLVPDSLPSQWYATFEKRGYTHSMWTMWFIYYMHIEQLYVVYHNLRVYTGNKNSCLSAHRAEIGLHFKARVRDEKYCKLLTVWKDEFVTFPKDIIRLHWDGTPMGNRSYFL